MNENAPVVSVIIPAYNAEKYIKETVKSVQNQTFTLWELIVIDDCSTDSTCQIAEELCAEDNRIKLVKNQVNSGVAEARNRGIELCNGQYIAFLDADDIWYPEKLERQVRIAQSEDADLVYCSYDVVDSFGEKSKDSYIVPESVSYEDLLKENVIGCSSVLVNRRALENRRFDSKFYHEDYVLWLKILADGGKVMGCSEVLMAWRHLQNSRSFNKRKSAEERWIIYRKHCKLSAVKSMLLMYAYAKAALRKYKTL